MIDGHQARCTIKISSTLNPKDQALIFSIPLSVRSVSDGWYWLADKMGNYSVKLGYMLLQDQAQESRVQLMESPLWKFLWKIKAPPKMLNLIWRSIANCLPTKSRLMQKHILTNNICPICSVSEETTLHALVTCPFAQEV